MLSVRRHTVAVPSYSVSGDLLAFLDCGLRYRYQHRGALPPSRPVQYWAGLFTHAMLEEALRHWQEIAVDLPWPSATYERIARLVDDRLKATGISFRGFRMFGLAFERAIVAIETWGPDLFPLIDGAETRLRAVRPMPADCHSIRGDRYEIQGIADIVARREAHNLEIPFGLTSQIALADGPFDLIIDYKGMRRPSFSDPAWEHQAWQLQTYAWLWAQQPAATSSRMALLLYFNELVPAPEDMRSLRGEAQFDPIQTDVPPCPADRATLDAWPTQERNWRQRLEAWDDQVRAWYLDSSGAQAFPRMPKPDQQLSWEYR